MILLIFISSVQTELELEPAAVAGLMATVRFGLLEPAGKGRSARYVLKVAPK